MEFFGLLGLALATLAFLLLVVHAIVWGDPEYYGKETKTSKSVLRISRALTVASGICVIVFVIQNIF